MDSINIYLYLSCLKLDFRVKLEEYCPFLSILITCESYTLNVLADVLLWGDYHWYGTTTVSSAVRHRFIRPLGAFPPVLHNKRHFLQ